MIKWLYTFCALLFLQLAHAQQGSFKITGFVLDSVSQTPVELATVSLRKPGNEKIISAITTNTEGNFILQNLKGGSYELSISFVGYQTKKITIEVSEDKNLGKISFAASQNTLSETEVKAEKSVITKNSEKTVFNVAQSPTNQTGTAEDVLRNMPGVMVDQKGNVSVIGKQGVKVLVDGRPNAQAQNDLPNFLKSIPANAIEAIELITNPSARYDAEGNAGIINIKLKKGKAEGLNGSISAGYGILDHYNGNASINYRKNKINVFGTYTANYNKTQNRYLENRTIGVNDSTSYYNLDSKGKEEHFNNSGKFGIDYLINDKNTLTYTGNINYSTFHWYSLANSQSLNSAQEKINSYSSTDDERYHTFSVNNDIAYRKKFDSTEQELDIDINHTYLNSGNHAQLNSTGYDSVGIYSPENSLWRRTQLANRIHNIVFQLDYIQPIKKLKGYKIELGAKNETTNNKNVFDAYKMVNNVEENDSLLSNKFDYIENIAAAYIIASGAYKSILSYSAGLRAEHTYIHSNNNSVNKNYISFFPSATVNVAISEEHNISTSYSRRIQRPQFRQINNTISYIDQFSTWQGNSFLQPAFSNIVSINYTAMVKKHMFSLEAAGNFEHNGFIESSRVDSNRITRGGSANGADSKVFSLTFYAKLQLTKWWEFQMNHNYTYSYFAYTPGLNVTSHAGHAYALWASTSFKFWKTTTLEVNGWINTGGAQAQGNLLPFGMLNASIKKTFFKDKFTVAIAGQNLLNTMKWKWTLQNTNLNLNGSWQALNRVVMITLTYRFGKNQPSPERRGHENDRLGGDGKGR